MSDDWMAPFEAARDLSAAAGDEAGERAAAARLMVETIDAIVLLMRPDGTIVESTRATMRTTGLDREDIIGSAVQRLPVWRSPTDASLVERLVHAAARGRSASASVEFSPEHRDELHAIWLVMRPVKGADGDVAFVMAYEQAAFAPQIERPTDEEPVARQLHRMMELRRRLVADATHDLRAPLLGIAAAADRLLASDDEDVRREGTRVRAAALAALVQTEEMTDLAGLEHRRTQLRLRDVDLVDVVRDVVRVFEAIGMERRLTLTVDTPPSLDWSADPDKVTSIVTNLVSNAIRYTPVGGRVRVSLRQEKNSAVLEVADSGPGIPAGERTTAFRRAWRGQDARRRTRGSGLGLAIVHEAVMLHQGTIEMSRAPEGGTLADVRLPRRPGATPDAGPSLREAAALRLATESTVADLRRDIDPPPRRIVG
jgi:signal transduction histidine kinase